MSAARFRPQGLTAFIAWLRFWICLPTIPAARLMSRREDHEDGRDGEGYVKLALLLGIGVQRDGQRRAGAGKAYDRIY